MRQSNGLWRASKFIVLLIAVSATPLGVLYYSKITAHKNTSLTTVNRIIAQEATATHTCPGTTPKETWENCNIYNPQHIAGVYEVIKNSSAGLRTTESENAADLFYNLTHHFFDSILPNATTQALQFSTLRNQYPSHNLPQIINLMTNHAVDHHYGYMVAYIWATAGIVVGQNNFVIYNMTDQQVQTMAQDQTPGLFNFTDNEVATLYKAYIHLPSKMRYMYGHTSLTRAPRPYTIFGVNVEFGAFASAARRQVVYGSNILNESFDRSDLFTTAQGATIHEHAHIYDTANMALYSEDASGPRWQALSGWRIADVPDSNTGAISRRWTIRSTDAGFLRAYGRTSPREDFADAVYSNIYFNNEFTNCCSEKQNYIIDHVFEGRRNNSQSEILNWWSNKLTASVLTQVLRNLPDQIDADTLYTQFNNTIYTHALLLYPQASGYLQSSRRESLAERSLSAILQNSFRSVANEYIALPVNTKQRIADFISNNTARNELLACMQQNESQPNTVDKREVIKPCYNTWLTRALTELSIPDALLTALRNTYSFYEVESNYTKLLYEFVNIMERRISPRFNSLIESCLNAEPAPWQSLQYLNSTSEYMIFRRNFIQCFDSKLALEFDPLFLAAQEVLQWPTVSEITTTHLKRVWAVNATNALDRRALTDALQRRAQLNLEQLLPQVEAELGIYGTLLALFGEYERYSISANSCIEKATEIATRLNSSAGTQLSSSPYFESLIPSDSFHRLCSNLAARYGPIFRTEHTQAIRLLYEHPSPPLRNLQEWARRHQQHPDLVAACLTDTQNALVDWTPQTHTTSLSSAEIKTIVATNYCTTTTAPIRREQRNREQRASYFYLTLPAAHEILPRITQPNAQQYEQSCRPTITTRATTWLTRGLPQAPSPPTQYIDINTEAQTIATTYCAKMWEQRNLFGTATTTIAQDTRAALYANLDWAASTQFLQSSCHSHVRGLITNLVNESSDNFIQYTIKPIINNTSDSNAYQYISPWFNFQGGLTTNLCTEFIRSSENAQRTLVNQVAVVARGRAFKTTLRQTLQTAEPTRARQRSICPQTATTLLTEHFAVQATEIQPLNALSGNRLPQIIQEHATRTCRNL